MLTEQRSYSLTNSKFLLTFLIVWLHCHISPSLINDVSGGYIFGERFMMMISDCAVPGFFAISAFLFFRNFDIPKYWDKLNSRVKSLLIPFLVFSFLGLLLEIVLEIVFDGGLKLSFMEMLRGVFTREYNRPLWFLLVLFEFVLITPAIYLFIQRFGRRGVIMGVLVLFAINLCLDKTTYVSLFYWLPLFLFFSYIGIAEKDGRIIEIPWYYGLIFIPIALLYSYYGIEIGHNNLYYIYRFVAGISLFYLGSILTWKPFSIEKFSMFVFCSHWLVNRLLFFIPSREYLSLIKVMIAFIICTLLAWLLYKIAPKMYSLVSGSR